MKNTIILLIGLLYFQFTNITYAQTIDFFTDIRDGKIYKTTEIGEQIWMAENLVYESDKGRKVYEDSSENVNKYGYLYNWESAKKVCPPGYHLPSDEEWEELAVYIDSIKGPFKKEDDDWNEIGKLLKAKSGWGYKDKGTDNFGFAALPGGGSNFSDPAKGMGSSGEWWSSTEYGKTRALTRKLSNASESFVRWSGGYKVYSYSVRCVKDN